MLAWTGQVAFQEAPPSPRSRHNVSSCDQYAVLQLLGIWAQVFRDLVGTPLGVRLAQGCLGSQRGGGEAGTGSPRQQ